MYVLQNITIFSYGNACDNVNNLLPTSILENNQQKVTQCPFSIYKLSQKTLKNVYRLSWQIITINENHRLSTHLDK